MLDEQLKALAASDVYPFHMPGHKRQPIAMENPYTIDITEIPGFDNLHDPQDVILEAMERMAALYGAKKSYLLVGGSTCGNLTAVFSAVSQRGCVIMGRNSHKSIYHAAWLRECEIVYTYPEVSKDGIVLGTPLSEYKRAIAEYPQAQAIVVTSPTYEGMMEPLDEIVALAHEHGIAVIVDAAHGAHLGFHPYFPKSPLDSGADAVIMSLHKTLPALTQTAVLHLSKHSLFSETDIAQYLDVFETSSPSYVLMTSICQCIRFLEQGKEAFATYAAYLDAFYQKCKALKHISVSHFLHQDPGKIVISTVGTNLSGHALEEILAKKYHIVLELSSFSYGLAMSSVMDTKEGFARLTQALFEIDDSIEAGKKHMENSVGQTLYHQGKQVMPYYEAMSRDKTICMLNEAEGKVAAAPVAIYPPGVPLIVPGEEIENRQILLLTEAKKQGLTITGLMEQGLFIVI